MTRYLASMVLGLLLQTTASAVAAEASSIRSGEQIHSRHESLQEEVAALKDRTRALEATVLELRILVRHLTSGGVVAARGYECVVSNSWDTFTGRGVTKVAATAGAIRSCEGKHAAIFCRDQPKCELIE